MGWNLIVIRMEVLLEQDSFVPLHEIYNMAH